MKELTTWTEILLPVREVDKERNLHYFRMCAIIQISWLCPMVVLLELLATVLPCFQVVLLHFTHILSFPKNVHKYGRNKLSEYRQRTPFLSISNTELLGQLGIRQLRLTIWGTVISLVHSYWVKMFKCCHILNSWCKYPKF